MNMMEQRRMPCNGQGVVVINGNISHDFSVCVGKNSEFFVLLVEKDKVKFFLVNNVQAEVWYAWFKMLKEHTLISELPEVGCGYEEDGTVSYWFSIDRDRLVLKYGKGYRMEETTLLAHDFLKDAKTAEERVQIRRKLRGYFSEGEKSVFYYQRERVTCDIRSYLDLEIYQIEEFPFVCNLSPCVIDFSGESLLTLDCSKFMLSGSLPPSCRELYETIRTCDLNLQDEVDGVLFAELLRYSIVTEGCILYKRIREKACGQNSDVRESLIQVTFDHCIGTSPGIRYVLEIRPSGHCSPIHNHGSANAVTKILFGAIKISIFNEHTTEPDAVPLREFDARAGDVTWMNRNWFQTHRLQNTTDDVCVTITCYNYDSDVIKDTPYIDYHREHCIVDEMLSGADFSFKEMTEELLKEYKYRHSREDHIYREYQTIISVIKFPFTVARYLYNFWF